MGADQIIYIRTDGNSQIATGHLVRCLSVAAACLALKKKVCFLVSDEESAGLLQGFMKGEGLTDSPFLSLKVLQTAEYAHLEKELPELISVLTSSPSLDGGCRTTSENASVSLLPTDKKPVLLLDSYFVTENYLHTLTPYVKLAYLDDLQLFDYPVMLLINYDVIPKNKLPLYQTAYQNAEKTLLGASYTPLRSQFQNREITVNEQVCHVLLTTGGSDPFHFCVRFLEKWKLLRAKATDGNPSVTLDVIVGSLNPDKEKLYQLAEELPFLILHETVTDMAALMEHCDLAVSASGTTLYELCALGVPSISFTIADNQLPTAEAFAESGAIPYAGDLRKNTESVMEQCIRFVTDMSSFVKRKAAHQAMHQLVDGSGALKIAAALTEL